METYMLGQYQTSRSVCVASYASTDLVVASPTSVPDIARGCTKQYQVSTNHAASSILLEVPHMRSKCIGSSSSTIYLVSTGHGVGSA
eukprot:636000-Rhodomonas_salina.1